MYEVPCTRYKVEIRGTHRGGQARYDIPANDECPTPNVELRSRKTYNYLNALLGTLYFVLGTILKSLLGTLYIVLGTFYLILIYDIQSPYPPRNTQPVAAKEGTDSGNIPCAQAQRPVVYRRKKIGAKERPALFSKFLARDFGL